MAGMKAEMYKVGTMGDGFLAIMARPDIEAQAPASIANIARLGIQQVVSLLEPAEARSLGLEAERLEVKANSMGFTSFPIPDMGLPASTEEFAILTRRIFNQVNRGINTLVHCRAGIGRSGLFSAGVLLHVGMDPDEAFAYVSRMRGIRVPETPEQRQWLISNYAAIVDNG
ncbi:MAG: tyrosine-protein phosphatase [Gammaproteobacteria bacterium]|nr:tyrosine-protein phosphatase [Gammaproteobacteria bacterium]MDH3447651.1 tyrosine-protein phosphatase [Gammaproteobacteria bacterium]